MNDIKYALSDKNCHIFDSYLTTSRDEMVEFCSKNLPERFTEARSISSYVKEWRAHNLLYSWHIAPTRTKDCDLNIGEGLFRRFCYFFLSLIYPHR